MAYGKKPYSTIQIKATVKDIVDHDAEGLGVTRAEFVEALILQFHDMVVV